VIATSWRSIACTGGCSRTSTYLFTRRVAPITFNGSPFSELSQRRSRRRGYRVVRLHSITLSRCCGHSGCSIRSGHGVPALVRSAHCWGPPRRFIINRCRPESHLPRSFPVALRGFLPQDDAP
jgi:hypothetical protein